MSLKIRWLSRLGEPLALNFCMLRPSIPALFITAVVLTAQEPNPTQQPRQSAVAVQPNTSAPLFRVEVIERTTSAINYLHRGGSTKVDFQGTPLMPSSKGEAKVESERGVIHVAAKFDRMAPPSSFGPEYLTYVLWAISPDGRPVNLGELTLSDYGKGSDSSIEATSDIQTFGLIVTAEPYYGVTQPSDVVVMENVVRPDTQGVRKPSTPALNCCHGECTPAKGKPPASCRSM
jgi:hypothetical protein